MHHAAALIRRLALILLTGLSAATAAPETWTSTAGATVEAEFTGLEAGVVSLRAADGKALRIQLADLTEASRQRAEACAAQAAAAAAKAATAAWRALSVPQRLATVWPPQYVTPTNASVLTTHSQPGFEAVVLRPTGRVNLFLKDGDRYLAEPLVIELDVWYHDAAKRTWPSRRFVALTAEPRFEKGEALFQMQREDGVEADVYVRAVKNVLEFGYRVKDPPGISIASNHRLTVTVPPALREDTATGLRYSPLFPRGVAQPDLAAALKTYRVEITSAEARSGSERKTAKGPVAYPYMTRVERFAGGPAAEVVIKGGMYGSHEVTFEPSSEREVRLGPYIYTSMRPADGYRIYLTKEAPESPAKSGLLRVTVK